MNNLENEITSLIQTERNSLALSKIKTYIEKNMSYARVEALFQPSMMLIVGIGSALILLFGGRLIINDVISLGDFVAFMLYLGMLIWPSIALGWVINGIEVRKILRLSTTLMPLTWMNLIRLCIKMISI